MIKAGEGGVEQGTDLAFVLEDGHVAQQFMIARKKDVDEVIHRDQDHDALGRVHNRKAIDVILNESLDNVSQLAVLRQGNDRPPHHIADFHAGTASPVVIPAEAVLHTTPADRPTAVWRAGIQRLWTPAFAGVKASEFMRALAY